ncbi:TlpA disulfide reductase family protein [Micromonospora sp. WMMD998]|uniref:TlpA family protein disulfide reductase n=1 Tax=Micromonospora sp. WMMD998 TaxID=3016092 RepID=UPI00249C19AA|nr:TlpA disulfide reductase family protein [Micromonospora sp. WMMD998]WFE39841.1 TlpA disulfide reductase family protein [Micromonospora sp. WMMD998]
MTRRTLRWGRLRPVPATALLLAVAVAAALAAARLSGPTDPGPGPAPAAPALAGATLDGGRFDLAALRGQVVLVNVFASWCGPCRDELPLVAETGRQWSSRGLRVVGLNLRDGPDAVRPLLAQSRAENLTVVPDPDGARSVEWGVRGVPETFLVDRDGRVVAHRPGVVTRQWLDDHLSALLAVP